MTLKSADTIPNAIITTLITLHMVVSDIDDDAHGPFANYSDPLAFAEPADGSVFECTMRLCNIKEV